MWFVGWLAGGREGESLIIFIHQNTAGARYSGKGRVRGLSTNKFVLETVGARRAENGARVGNE